MGLLSGWVDVVAVLACHRVIDGIESRLHSRHRRNYRLHPASQLLMIQSHVWRHWWGSEQLLSRSGWTMQIESLKLLSRSSHIDQLLLKTLLLLSQI
jgi:hypothetical protein